PASPPAPWRSCSPPGRTRPGPPARRRSRILLPVQRRRLVHGLLAALLAAHHVLRLLGGGRDRAAGLLAPVGDLLLDLAVRGGAVAAPAHPVADGRLVLVLLRHEARATPARASRAPRRVKSDHVVPQGQFLRV